MRATMMRMPLSLNQLLEHANALYSSREVVSRRPDESLHHGSYGAAYRRARRLAQAQQRAGVGRGEAVGILGTDRYAPSAGVLAAAAICRRRRGVHAFERLRHGIVGRGVACEPRNPHGAKGLRCRHLLEVGNELI